MAHIEFTEIAKGGTVYSKKHQRNVKVVKVNEDTTVDIEYTVTDTVPASDLEKKHKD